MHDHPRRARRPSRALERRGQAGSAKESAALAVEAAKLKGHLTKLAKAAHLDPAQWAPAGDAAPVAAGAAPAPAHCPRPRRAPAFAAPPHRGRAAPGSSQVLHPCGTARSAQPVHARARTLWCVSRQN